MKHVALIFPGQGAQKVGMGAEFYQHSLAAQAIFDEANRICGQELSKVIFEGPDEKLVSTAFCQPAILTMSIAALKAFESYPQFKQLSIHYTAGLSLGEYSALVASGALSFEQALRLVQKRAALMEEATHEAQGSMAAIIGFDKQLLTGICQQTGAEIANFNSHEQIVITGSTKKVNAAIELIKAAGGQKIIPLAVSGAFHSSLMANAALKYSLVLKEVPFNTINIPVISNVNAKPQTQAIDIRANLAQQITASVQWVNSIEYMASQGITHFIEIGPGKVLKGLMRRINPALSVSNIEKPSDFDTIFA